MIDRLLEDGHRAKVCCRLLGVSSPGYYKYRNRPLSPTQMHRQWLTDLIRKAHAASRQTYGARRAHANSRSGWASRSSNGCSRCVLAGVSDIVRRAKRTLRAGD